MWDDDVAVWGPRPDFFSKVPDFLKVSDVAQDFSPFRIIFVMVNLVKHRLAVYVRPQKKVYSLSN